MNIISKRQWPNRTGNKINVANFAVAALIQASCHQLLSQKSFEKADKKILRRTTRFSKPKKTEKEAPSPCVLFHMKMNKNAVLFWIQGTSMNQRFFLNVCDDDSTVSSMLSDLETRFLGL